MKTSDNVASIKEYYGKFFSLYNATNYVSALKEMRTFIEGISKYGITEISCQCYKKNKLLIDTELFLVYKYNYYIVSAIDISRKSKPLTVRKIEQNSISEGQQINDISYDDDKYGNVKVKGGNCYKFQSSGLPSIFYNLIALQTKQLNKAQQNQILTKIKGLIDKYKLCNTYAHDEDHTSAEVDAKCVYDSIKGEINGIISALKLYYPLENTIKLLESLSSDSQKEIKNGSKKDMAVSQKQRVEVKRHEVADEFAIDLGNGLLASIIFSIFAFILLETFGPQNFELKPFNPKFYQNSLLLVLSLAFWAYPILFFVFFKVLNLKLKSNFFVFLFKKLANSCDRPTMPGWSSVFLTIICGFLLSFAGFFDAIFCYTFIVIFFINYVCLSDDYERVDSFSDFWEGIDCILDCSNVDWEDVKNMCFALVFTIISLIPITIYFFAR